MCETFTLRVFLEGTYCTGTYLVDVVREYYNADVELSQPLLRL